MALILRLTDTDGDHLGLVEIVNDATGTPVLGNYDVYAHAPDRAVTAAARIESYDRTQGAWPLAHLALNALANNQEGPCT